MRCKNIYCLHHVLNSEGSMADWNDTDCGMCKLSPAQGRGQNCKAKKRYDAKAGVFMLNYEKMKFGDSFFIPGIKDTKSCKTVYRNVRKMGLKAVLKKDRINDISGIKIDILKVIPAERKKHERKVQ